MAKRPPVEVPEGHKYCFQCNTAKPFSDFYRCRRRHDGVNYCCKPCTAASRERTKMTYRLIDEARQEVREFLARNPLKPYERPIRPMSVY